MMDADFILPCDVHLPPATVLRKGVTMSAFLTAMRQREGMDEGMTCFNRDAKRSDLDALARSAQDHGGEANEMIGTPLYTEADHPAPQPGVEAGDVAGGWLSAMTPPYAQEVEVRVGAMRFRAKLMQGASLDENGRSCDQWQAAREGEHPPCWTDGACWESNADLSPSLQVDAWRFVRPASSSTGKDGRTLVRAPANGGRDEK